MTSLILVAHGKLAVETKASLEMIYGTCPQVSCTTFLPSEGLETVRDKIIDALPRTGEVLILRISLVGRPSTPPVPLRWGSARVPLRSSLACRCPLCLRLFRSRGIWTLGVWLSGSSRRPSSLSVGLSQRLLVTMMTSDLG